MRHDLMKKKMMVLQKWIVIVNINVCLYVCERWQIPIYKIQPLQISLKITSGKIKFQRNMRFKAKSFPKLTWSNLLRVDGNIVWKYIVTYIVNLGKVMETKNLRSVVYEQDKLEIGPNDLGKCMILIAFFSTLRHP